MGEVWTFTGSDIVNFFLSSYIDLAETPQKQREIQDNIVLFYYIEIQKLSHLFILELQKVNEVSCRNTNDLWF